MTASHYREKEVDYFLKYMLYLKYFLEPRFGAMLY